MSWNRTGSTLMQSSGEFRLTEPLSTALVEAALRGDKSGVFRLIGQGSWVEQRDSMWKTRPVIGQPEHIRQLAAPANWQVCSGWSATPALLPTHRRDASGYTALLRAAGQGDVANVKRLLKVGADREARNLVRRRHARRAAPALCTNTTHTHGSIIGMAMCTYTLPPRSTATRL